MATLIRRFRWWLLRRQIARHGRVSFPGTTIRLHDNSTVAYRIDNVDLRRRADDE
jgi:hypothetical protein